ncbi:MAG: hypothetical protein QM661_03315 [Solimonas sp.]
MRANGHCRNEQHRRRSDGSPLIVDSTLDALRGENGELIGLLRNADAALFKAKREGKNLVRA